MVSRETWLASRCSLSLLRGFQCGSPVNRGLTPPATHCRPSGPVHAVLLRDSREAAASLSPGRQPGDGAPTGSEAPAGAASKCPFAIGAVLSLVALAFAQPASADAPQVQFDVAPMVACRDVTPPEFSQINPDERLIEARFQISALLRGGNENDLTEFLYLIDSPQRSMAVEDYLPKTTLATDVVGSVGIDRRDEDSVTNGIKVDGDASTYLKANFTRARTKTNGERVQYERLPPLELLSASGTMSRGAAAYFKLKPSPRTSLEGAKDFVLILRVPALWRGDYVRLRCDAVGYDRGVVRQFDESKHCGRGEFYVALYAEGDLPAKQAAAAVVDTERHFRMTVSQSRQAIGEKRYPTPVHRLGSLLSVSEPKIPDAWFQDILRNPAENNLARYERHLPEGVRESAKRYQTAQKKLRKLNGQPQ